MKEVVKIVAYLAGTLVLGVFLAPLLFWNLGWLQRWALANGMMNWDPHDSDVLVNGPMGFLTADFQSCFSFALLLGALILLVPAARAFGVRSLRADLRLYPPLRPAEHFWRGLAIGVAGLLVLASYCILMNFAHPRTPVPWLQLPKVVLSVVVIGLAEEIIYRGFIQGFLLKGMRPALALAWSTALYAGMHFLEPVRQAQISRVTWRSGMELLSAGFHQFTNPVFVFSAFLPMVVCGWLYGYARMRTQALRMSIGLHIGVLLCVSLYGSFIVQTTALLPWIGWNLRTGLASTAALLVALTVTWRRLEHEDLLPNPKARD